MPLALMESAHPLPHQVFGLSMGPRPQQAFEGAGATFHAII